MSSTAKNVSHEWRVSPSRSKQELQTPTQNLIFKRCHFEDCIIVDSFRKNNSTHWRLDSPVGFVYQTIGYLRIDSKRDLEKRKSLAWEQIWISIDLVRNHIFHRKINYSFSKFNNLTRRVENIFEANFTIIK